MWRHEGSYLLANDLSVDNAVCDEYISKLSCSSECLNSDSECDNFKKYDFNQFEFLQRCISAVEYDSNDWKKSTCNYWYF